MAKGKRRALITEITGQEGYYLAHGGAWEVLQQPLNDAARPRRNLTSAAHLFLRPGFFERMCILSPHPVH